jgi:hypothetical protein
VEGPGGLAKLVSPAGSERVESWLRSARRPVTVGVNISSGPAGVEGQLEDVSGSSEPVSESFLVMED